MIITPRTPRKRPPLFINQFSTKPKFLSQITINIWNILLCNLPLANTTTLWTKGL